MAHTYVGRIKPHVRLFTLTQFTSSGQKCLELLTILSVVSHASQSWYRFSPLPEMSCLPLLVQLDYFQLSFRTPLCFESLPVTPSPVNQQFTSCNKSSHVCNFYFMFCSSICVFSLITNQSARDQNTVFSSYCLQYQYKTCFTVGRSILF